MTGKTLFKNRYSWSFDVSKYGFDVIRAVIIHYKERAAGLFTECLGDLRSMNRVALCKSYLFTVKYYQFVQVVAERCKESAS